MTRNRRPGTSLQSRSWELEPALDGEILPREQPLPRAPLYPKVLGRGPDHRRQAREEIEKAESEHAFAYYIDAVTGRVRKQQELARALMGWALVRDRHELDRLEERDRYNRRLEEIADRRDALDERRESRAERSWRAGMSREHEELDLRMAKARAARVIAECQRDIARFAQETHSSPGRTGMEDAPEFMAAFAEEGRRTDILRTAERHKEAVRRNRMSEDEKRQAIERIDQACRRALKAYDLGQAGIVMPEDDEE